MDFGATFLAKRLLPALLLVAFSALLPRNCNAQACDPSLAKHIYHSQRLVTQQACVSVTGTWVDASHGRTADGCRHEKDGDGHCFIKLDKGQEKYLNNRNMENEDGNLVVEPICVYRTTQADAIPACKDWHQQIALPKIGSHVRVTGVWVLDTQHGHMEIHPVTSIEVLAR